MERVKSRTKNKSKTDLCPPSARDIWNKLTRNYISPQSAGYVFVVNKTAPFETQHYLLSILQSKPLNVSVISLSDGLPAEEENLTLLVTCDQAAINQQASNVYMPQQLSRQSLNINSELTLPEQERILLHILEIIVQTERTTLVGFPDVTMYPGQSISN